MLVEVHPGVQAARLLERRPVVAARVEGVEGTRVVGEEPERVEVRAADPVLLHHGVGARAAEPQRPGGVPHLLLRQPVDHRPLVHPEAAELRCPSGGRDQQPVQRLDQQPLRHQVLVAHRRHAAPDDVPLESGVRRALRESHAVAGVPAPQRRRPLRVVAEQEVLDGVRDTLTPALQVRPDPRVHALLVRGATGLPGGHLERFHRHQGRQRPGRARR